MRIPGKGPLRKRASKQYGFLYPTSAGSLQVGMRLGGRCGSDPSLVSPVFE